MENVLDICKVLQKAGATNVKPTKGSISKALKALVESDPDNLIRVTFE